MQIYLTLRWNLVHNELELDKFFDKITAAPVLN